MTTIAAAFLISYLIGSVSFAYIAGRLKGVDLKKEGSGNLGAVNVKRAVGLFASALVLILDALKGAAAVWLSMEISENPYAPMLGWLGVICGHGWSVFLKFKGGKGLACSVGALSMISPIVLGSELWIGFLMFIFTRNVYIASIVMTVILPAVVYLMTRNMVLVEASIPVSFIVLILHRKNIKEILDANPPS